MKKIYKSLILAIATIMLMLSATACSLTFIDNSVKPGQNNNTNNNQSEDQTGVLDEVSGPSSKEIYNSMSLVQEKNVVFATNENATLKNKEQTIEDIYTSAVAIKIEKNGGSSAGSGIIVDISKNQDNSQSGNIFYVLTCHHVVSSGGNIVISVMDKEKDNVGDNDYNNRYQFSGVIDNEIHLDTAVTLVGGDAVADLALLKIDITKHAKEAGTNDYIDMSHIHKAKISPESRKQLKLGQEVIAIGNPSGNYPGTVTTGTISYVSRDTIVNEVGYLSLIQFDVMTSEGNSGGGLFNLYGDLVGITNAGNVNARQINFAIPAYASTKLTDNDGNTIDNGFVNIAKNLLATSNETNYGYVSGRWMFGFYVSSSLVSSGNESGVSAIVEGVIKNGNANKAGVLVGDIITGIKYTDSKGVVHDYEILTLSDFKARRFLMLTDLTTKDTITLIVSRQTNVTYKGDRSEQQISVSLSVQNIFCDTGDYTLITKPE